MSMSKHYIKEKRQQIGDDLVQGKLSKTQQEKALRIYQEMSGGTNTAGNQK